MSPADLPSPPEMRDKAYEAGARAIVEIILKALREREQDLLWCMKDDDCDVQAQGVRLAADDVKEAVRGWLPDVLGIQWWECCGHQGCCEPAGIDKYHACKLSDEDRRPHR